MSSSNDSSLEEVAVLFHAALLGRTDVLKQVISQRAKNTDEKDLAKFVSTARSDDGATALHLASASGHSDVVRALLQIGADATARAWSGDFVEKRPYEVATDNVKKTYHVCLFEQVALGNIANIIKLIRGGIPTSTLDGSKINDTTLHWACSFGNTEVVKTLISLGCDVNCTNELGQTGLHVASKNNHIDLIKLLLDEGASPTKCDLNNKYPKDYLTDKSSEFTNLFDISNFSPSMTFHKMYLESIDKSNHDSVYEEKEKESSKQAINSNSIVSNVSDIFNKSSSISNSEPQNTRPLLVLWPPPQRQSFLPGPPLELSTSSSLLLCVASSEIDIFPLLTWSGLMDNLDKLGFQAQVKRSAPFAKIRLSINSTICPGSSRYEIVVNSEYASITASDSTALLYAVQTFVQLLQLQSVVKTHAGVTEVRIPAILIKDWPDIPNRSVIWCYRAIAKSMSSSIRETVELLSKLRINLLLLVMDTLSNNDEQYNRNIELENQQSTTKVYAIDEVCRRHGISLAPTILITSIFQSLSQEILHNFSCSMISIHFLFDLDSIIAELIQCGEETVSHEHARDIAIVACKRIFFEAQGAGFQTVMLICSQWVTDHIHPYKLGLQLGLNILDGDLKTILPQSLFNKPLISTNVFVDILANYSNEINKAGYSFAILPAFLDSDFCYPSLLIKYYCLLYGGFFWNRQSTMEILNVETIEEIVELKHNDKSSSTDTHSIVKIHYDIPVAYGQLIREVTNFLLFSSFVPMIRLSSDNISIMSTILDILTGDIMSLVEGSYASSSTPSNTSVSTISSVASFFFGSSVASHSQSQLDLENTDNHKQSDILTDLRSLPSTELKLWPLASGMCYVRYGNVPVKTQAILLHRIVRRLIQSSTWKPTNQLVVDVEGINKNDAPDKKMSINLDLLGIPMDVEEYFVIVNIFSIIVRAIVLAFNITEKSHKRIESTQDLSFEDLIESLPPGTKSDLANNLLEGIEYLASIWKKKYDRIEFSNTKQVNSSNSILRNVGMELLSENWFIQQNKEVDNETILTYIRAKFLLQSKHHIPLSAVFVCITSGLVMPKSVEDIMKKLFD